MDPERARQKLEELNNRNKRKYSYWSPKEGANHLRILPNWELDLAGDFYKETGQHRKLGSKQDITVVCLIKEGHPRCPVCEYVKKLWSTKNKDDAALAKSIGKQGKVYFNIVDFDELEKGVQIWSSGPNVLGQLLKFVSNPKYGDITDPENGRNVDVFFTKGDNTKSGFNEYEIQPDPDRTPLQDATWLERMTNLSSLVKLRTEAELDYLMQYGEFPDVKEAVQEDEAAAPVEAAPPAAVLQAPPEAAKAPPATPPAAAPLAAPVAAPVVTQGELIPAPVAAQSDAAKTKVQALLEKLRAEKAAKKA